MPTTITPTNCVSKPIVALLNTLAASTACQTFLGAGNEAAALAKIHLHELPQPTNKEDYSDAEWASLHPLVLITAPEGEDWFSLDAIATGQTYTEQFRAMLEFQRIVTPGALTEGDIALDMIEKVGSVIKDMADVAGQPDKFWFTSIRIGQPVWRADRQDRINLGDLQALWVFVEAAEDA